MPAPVRIDRRNARFQQWQALLTNRTKRTRAGEMIVQGVRPITQAIAHGHEVRTLLVNSRERPSRWASELIASSSAPVVHLAPELMAELGERSDGPPEVLAVIALPSDDVSLLRPAPGADASPLIVAFDRPANPGNIGTIARSVDALGASGLAITGHGADPWDPAAIRASTGSMFAVPTVRLDSPRMLLDELRGTSRNGSDDGEAGFRIICTDEHGDMELADAPFTGPTVLVIGSEARGMSAAWREACDVIATIPMTGSASSLNAANAATVALYEAMQQRRGRGRRPAATTGTPPPAPTL